MIGGKSFLADKIGFSESVGYILRSDYRLIRCRRKGPGADTLCFNARLSRCAPIQRVIGARTCRGMSSPSVFFASV